jgi:multicomponent Na+:H+ antiporter subunit E
VRRLLAHVAGLTTVWVLLWGRLTFANVTTGALASVALLVVFPVERGRRDAPIAVRPLAVLRLLLYFVIQLVVSNAVLTWQIVRPHPALRTGIVACQLHTRSPGLITLITDILALSPGTITVDVDTPDDGGPSTIFVHVLRLDDPADVRARVARLERTVVVAFGTRDEVMACRAADGPPVSRGAA